MPHWCNILRPYLVPVPIYWTWIKSTEKRLILNRVKIALRLRDWHVFMWKSLQILNVFNISTLKQILGKTQTLLKKLECCFLVESTNTENTTFPYKTVLLEANVKTNRMANAKWTYHKEQSFARNYFIFSKILIQFKNPV